ncbi:arabinogalactan peptide 22-like [Arachis hypogaea]|nr:arabinogalactan peptide 22-like [Arachis hypogaea]
MPPPPASSSFDPSLRDPKGRPLQGVELVLPRSEKRAGTLCHTFEDLWCWSFFSPLSPYSIFLDLDFYDLSRFIPNLITSCIVIPYVCVGVFSRSSVDQGIAYVLMLLALALTYLIHSADLSTTL